MRRMLVFDLDDTLFPEHEFVLSGFREVGDWLERRHGVAGFVVEARRLFDSGVRGTIFDDALRRLKGDAPKELVRELVHVYREHSPTISLHPDAAWALPYFHRKYALGLLTDGYLATQRNKVHTLGIDPYFEVVVYSDEGGREAWKPSSIPYRRLMAEARVSASSCIYVSDNPAKDFIRARELGWYTVQILRQDGEYRNLQHDPAFAADAKISTLYDLEQALVSAEAPS